jgi:HAD superfamily hydrolase (TIGR01509 family)
VAFDLDGLMFNTEDLYDEVLDALLQRRGQRLTRELKLRMMGLPGLLAASVLIDCCGLSDTPQALLGEAHDGLARMLPERLRPLPGLLDILQLVEQYELPVSIATSSSPAFAESALAISGLRQRFRFVLTADDVTRGKPHPDIYVESARRHQVLPRQLLVLEDSVTGSRAGAAAGAVTVAIPGHHSQGQDFDHADYRFDSLNDPQLAEMIRQRRA